MSNGNPQLEDGYTSVSNELAEAFAWGFPGHGEGQVMWAILRKTYGWHKKEDAISISQIEQLTGLSRRMVIYCLQNLEAKQMIVITRSRAVGINEINNICIQKDYSKWVVQEKAEGYRKTISKQVQKYSARKMSRGSARNENETKVVQEKEQRVVQEKAEGYRKTISKQVQKYSARKMSRGSARNENETKVVQEKEQGVAQNSKIGVVQETGKGGEFLAPTKEKDITKEKETVVGVVQETVTTGGKYTLGDVMTSYENNIGILGPIVAQEINELIKEYTAEWILEAIKEAVNNNVRRLSYIKGILESWKLKGFKYKPSKKDNAGQAPGSEPINNPARRKLE